MNDPLNITLYLAVSCKLGTEYFQNVTKIPQYLPSFLIDSVGISIIRSSPKCTTMSSRLVDGPVCDGQASRLSTLPRSRSCAFLAVCRAYAPSVPARSSRRAAATHRARPRDGERGWSIRVSRSSLTPLPPPPRIHTLCRHHRRRHLFHPSLNRLLPRTSGPSPTKPLFGGRN